MNSTVWIIIAVVAVILIGGGVGLYIFQKKNMTKLFVQIYENVNQVPKQKKKSFTLLMFSEALAGSNRKTRKTYTNKLNNPKYVEVQLLKMSKILKDPSGSHGKKATQALRMLKNYQAWEAKKFK